MSTLNTNNSSSPCSVGWVEVKVRVKDKRGLMMLWAVAQMKQVDETQWGQRARYLAIARYPTLLPHAAGGETWTVDTHLARQSDKWLLVHFVTIRMGQYEYTHSQMASYQGHCPALPYSCSFGFFYFSFFLCWLDQVIFSTYELM